MTEVDTSAEAVNRLRADAVLAARCLEEDQSFPTGQSILIECDKVMCALRTQLADAKAENDMLRAFAEDFADYHFTLEAERTGPEPDDHGERFTDYDIVRSFQEDAVDLKST